MGDWDDREWGEKRRMSSNGLSMVENIGERIGQRVIFGESRYTKRNGLYVWCDTD